MGRKIRIGHLIVGDDYPPICIAEMCNNMDGDIVKAKEMLEMAMVAGAHAVKFQMRLKRKRLKPAEHYELRKICAQNSLPYIITAFDQKSLEACLELKPDVLKIGSAECQNATFVRDVGLSGVPVIVSTGGSGWVNCNSIWHVISKATEEYAMMHSTSIYPTPYMRVNLGVIRRMRERFYCPIGLSCHTPTIYTAIASVGYGASMIEKHFSIDASDHEGPDQSSSIRPMAFREMVKGVAAVWQARHDNKIYFDEEKVKLEPMRNPK